MQCYVRLGLRARALHQYRMCEQILGQEYGTSPSPETRSLYLKLLRDERA
jgi:DNA-binding SARP family transcriptional activator